MSTSRTFRVLQAISGVVILAGAAVTLAYAQTPNPVPPPDPVKLIFIHHSTGENWLADVDGGLGLALQENNYFVSDTNYGWGPDSIGDRTDIPNWPEWFLGPNSAQILDALYNESRANAGGWDYYSRTMDDPGGENQIIVFKSCFPNSDLAGSPDDPADPGEDFTVANAKYIYNQLLGYFATRPDKLFVVITPPPLLDPSHAENARAFSNWLVDDWLAENAYPHANIAVWDFHNLLTDPDNHHQYANGAIEHVTSNGDGTLYYDSGGDEHPNNEGNRRATDEFVPMLNVFYNNWQASNPPQSPVEVAPAEDEPAEQQPAAQPEAIAGGLIDAFDSGAPAGTDGWESFWDESTPNQFTCAISDSHANSGSNSLQVDFDVVPNSWATCQLAFSEPQDWSSGPGLSLAMQASSAGLVYEVLVFDDRDILHAYTIESPPDSTSRWVQIEIPWDQLTNNDTGAPLDPQRAMRLALAFNTFPDTPNIGTIWVDDLSLMGQDVPQGEAPAGVEPTPEIIEEQVPEEIEIAAEPQGDQGGLPFCSGLAFLMSFIVFGMIIRKRPRHLL